MNRVQSVVLPLCFALLSTGAWAQSTIHVPADKTTIQAAIDAAVNGDTVLVAAGTYKERIDFKGKNITVTSESGAAQTIIDGKNSGNVVTFNTSETSAAVLSGFTIQHGNSDYGAGINIGGAGPTIEHNIITDNNCATGGGIYAAFASAIIRYNWIRHNNRGKSCYPSGIGGGGVTIGGAGTVQLLYNLIEDNLGGYDGGGISMWAAGSALVEGNIVRKNSSTGSTGGGIAIANEGTSIIRYNTFVNNSGSGVMWYGPPAAFIGNTVAGNDGGSAPSISGIYAYTFGSMEFRNNLVIGKAGQSAISCYTGGITYNTQFVQNDVYSNGATAYSGCDDQTGLNGNVSVDPLFANESAGNFHLSTGSTAIDAADQTVSYIPANDVDGNPRVVDAGNGPKLDLGAYEYQGATTMTVSPGTLNFDPQRTNSASAAQAVTVQNTGTQALHLKSAQLGADFTQTNTCELPDGLAVNASCTYSVVFQPASAGDKSESMVVAGGNVSGTSTVALTGTGTQPIVSLSTANVNFGDQALFTTSAPHDVLVNNIGDANLVVSSVSISGEFAQTNNCAKVVPNSNCKISVTFTPIATRTRTGTITITDDATGSPRQVALTGFGTGPEISFSPQSLDFPAQPVGTIGSAKILTITNTGSSDLTLSKIDIIGDFFQTNDCPSALASTLSCHVTVTFKPALYGGRQGMLTFTDNAAYSPQVVTLGGLGTAPIAYLGATSLTFSGQVVVNTSSSPLSVSLTNYGNDVLAIQSITASGDFSQTNNCGPYILPSAGCSIAVTFTPTASGTRTGTLTITDNANGSPRTVSLQGTGVTQYPVPVMTSISPNTAKAGSPVTVTITGTGLFATSVAYLDGQALTTIAASFTSLTATIDASLLNSFGEHTISVVNPAPGGGTSNNLPFTVYLTMPLTAKDLVYDRYRRVFYASVPSNAASYPNTVVTIDPTTATMIGTPMSLGSNPGPMAISDDGQFLYVGLMGTSKIKRVNLYTNQVDLEIALGSDSFFGAYLPLKLAVVPGAPHSLVASLQFANVGPYEAGVKVFDDGVARSASLEQSLDIDSIVFSSDPKVLYGATGGISPATLYVLKLDATGLTQISSHWDSLGSPITSDGSLVYSGNAVVDPTTYAQVGTFSFISTWVASVYPEPDTTRVYLLEGSYDGSAKIWVSNNSTFDGTGPLVLQLFSSYTPGNLSKLQRWGSDGLAFISAGYSPSSSDQVVFLRSSIVNPAVGGNLASLTALLPSVKAVGSQNFEMKLRGSGFQPGAVVKWNGAERTTTYVDATEVRALIPSTDVAQAGQAAVTVANPGAADTNALNFIAGSSLNFSAASLNFGNDIVKSTSSNLSVTVTNNTKTDYMIWSVLAIGEFKQTNNCTGNLAAGTSCTVQVAFRPTAATARVGTLLISSNAPGSPLAVDLSGTGTNVTISPTRPARPGRGQSTGASSSASAQARSTIGRASGSQIPGTVHSSGEIEWFTVPQLFTYWAVEPSPDEHARPNRDEPADAVPTADKKKLVREAE